MTPTSLSTRDAGWIIFILALGAGFSVASIYYAQPLLPLMGANLHLTVEGMGLVPTLTQAGYALGILFLLPLGDRHDRRRLILVKSALLALLLLLCSLTGQLSWQACLSAWPPPWRRISSRRRRSSPRRASREKWWAR